VFCSQVVPHLVNGTYQLQHFSSAFGWLNLFRYVIPVLYFLYHPRVTVIYDYCTCFPCLNMNKSVQLHKDLFVKTYDGLQNFEVNF
jgi:hypothetical protein